MEVIQLHPFRDTYPFGLDKETDATFVQVIRHMNSNQELDRYQHNLKIFKDLTNKNNHTNINNHTNKDNNKDNAHRQNNKDNSQKENNKQSLLINLDSFVFQQDSLQIYYQYQPQSLTMFIYNQAKLMKDLNEFNQQKQFNNLINNINQAIDSVINQLGSKGILVVLSIQSIAVTSQNFIKFFVDPDFQIVSQQAHYDLIHEYYKTERKKLQIQLQQSFQNILCRKNKTKKANFIIQGTKLVFSPQQQAIRQNNIQIVSAESTNQSINKMKQNKNSENQQKMHINSKKFDISNILDSKKVKKNINTQLPNQNLIASNTFIPKDVSPHSIPKNSHQISNQTITSAKQVKNYFQKQNNDDFNKDASFYPEQFIKEDSIAEIQGYQEELQKELLNLKDTQDTHIQELQDLEMSLVNQIGKNQANINKFNTQINNNNKIQININRQNSQATNKHLFTQTMYTKQIFNINNILKTNQNQNQKMYKLGHVVDSNTQQIKPNNQSIFVVDVQSAHEIPEKKKKKYKVMITTSHQVDVDNQNDMKKVQNEIIQDIKRGKIFTNDNNIMTTDKIKQNLSYNNIANQKEMPIVAIHSPSINLTNQPIKQLQKPFSSTKTLQSQLIHKPSQSQPSSISIPKLIQNISKTKQIENIGGSQVQVYDIYQGNNNNNNQINQSNQNNQSNPNNQVNFMTKQQQIQKIIDKIKNYGHLTTIQSNKRNQQVLRRDSVLNQKQTQIISGISTDFTKPQAINTYSPVKTQISSSKTIKSETSLQQKGQANTDSISPEVKDHDKQQKVQKARKKAEQIMRQVKQRRFQQS